MQRNKITPTPISITAETDQAGALARMRLNGTTDPQADVILAQSRYEQANAYFKELEVQANAITLLKDMAQEAQNRMAAEFTRPLAEAVNGYLECIFGAGSAMELTWVSGGKAAGKREFTIQHINRQGFGAFPFSVLSGGAREQVGVAMRLAMAEVLAADHDGCLPVVLDDAFTNSDPERVAMLHRMLYRAAGRGLQVIVLSSNPEHYGTLGGKEVRLSRPILTAPPILSTAIVAKVDDSGDQEEDQQNEPGEMNVPATGHKDTFQQQLRALGGSAGNQTLREALRWDETTYDAVKSVLLADGIIKTGRGRGGSVQLVDDLVPQHH